MSEIINFDCVAEKNLFFKESYKIYSVKVDKEKYPDIVSVYSIGDVSKEICMGPHVKNTSELGTFKIVKEESSSAGVRRIKAVLK